MNFFDDETVKIRQRWALLNVCRSVDECNKPGVRADLNMGAGRLGTSLSIDFFDLDRQPLAWHAGVAIILPNGQGKPFNSWTQTDRFTAFDVCKRMLEGVGQREAARLETGALSIEIILPLTADEAATFGHVIADPHSTLNAGQLPKQVIGSLGFYDVTNKKSQVGDGLFIPTERSLIYG